MTTTSTRIQKAWQTWTWHCQWSIQKLTVVKKAISIRAIPTWHAFSPDCHARVFLFLLLTAPWIMTGSLLSIDNQRHIWASITVLIVSDEQTYHLLLLSSLILLSASQGDEDPFRRLNYIRKISIIWIRLWRQAFKQHLAPCYLTISNSRISSCLVEMARSKRRPLHALAESYHRSVHDIRPFINSEGGKTSVDFTIHSIQHF